MTYTFNPLAKHNESFFYFNGKAKDLLTAIKKAAATANSKTA